jgi:hypothetical protein
MMMDVYPDSPLFSARTRYPAYPPRRRDTMPATSFTPETIRKLGWGIPVDPEKAKAVKIAAVHQQIRALLESLSHDKDIEAPWKPVIVLSHTERVTMTALSVARDPDELERHVIQGIHYVIDKQLGTFIRDNPGRKTIEYHLAVDYDPLRDQKLFTGHYSIFVRTDES